MKLIVYVNTLMLQDILSEPGRLLPASLRGDGGDSLRDDEIGVLIAM